MSGAKLSDEERVMFCTLQGIVNRSRPRILLFNHNEEPRSTWPTAHGLRTASIPTTSPYNLVKLFQEEIRGLVLYSNKLSEHYSNLAITIAGLERLLPVTAEVRGKLVAAGIFCNVALADQFLSIILTSSVFKDVYRERGYESRLLSRTCEDGATVTSVLVPWNTCGLVQSTVLGVATLTYLPYCFFNLLSPLMSIVFAATGRGIKRQQKVEV